MCPGICQPLLEYRFRERLKDGTFSFALKLPLPVLSILYSNFVSFVYILCFPGGSVVKNPPANAGGAGSIPGLGRFPWRSK